MNKTHLNTSFIILLFLLTATPSAAIAKVCADGATASSTRPCFIKLNDQTIFDGNKITFIEVENNNITSRNVIIHFGAQFTIVTVSDDSSATKYISDLLGVIHKSCD